MLTVTQSRNRQWSWGDGALSDEEGSDQGHILIDPQDDHRTVADNYRLLISGIIPRPIGFVSTLSQNGKPNACQKVRVRSGVYEKTFATY